MARKVRIEFPGAHYHVINRGNYRDWIFETPGARRSFLECLNQCCVAQGWQPHAWVLMGNHYHLCLKTPDPNLVDGMKWLQSTFANRFNRFRKANGHVFQGRYKAILLDGDAVGPVCHYIHLNPVRAGLVTCSELHRYEPGSFRHLWYPRRRWGFYDPTAALAAAGDLADTPKGRRLYVEYLGWLSEEDEEKKRQGFERMSRGWVKGAREFRQAVLADLKDESTRKVVEREAAELREPRWERATGVMLSELGQDEAAVKTSAKGVAWKVAAARMLRERYLTPHRWIAERLNMGRASSVQSLVSRHRTGNGNRDPFWRRLKNHETLD